MMYDIFYNKLKSYYKERISYIYGDTDSILLKIDDCDDIYEEIKQEPLNGLMDLSNFHDHPLHSNTNKGTLGKLKSECGVFHINEVIALAPKCYSILLEGGKTKSTLKGVNMSEQQKMTHEMYRNVLK